MRHKALKGEVFAVQLTVDKLELVEKICNGAIKGIKLERKDRIIHFYFDDQEHELGMSDWYVEFRTPGQPPIRQVWSDKQFRTVFEDDDDTPY